MGANHSDKDLVQIDDLQERIENGRIFEVSSKITGIANNGGAARWLFKTPNRTQVIVYDRRIATNGDEFNYQVFRGPQVSANGTEVTNWLNRDDEITRKQKSKLWSAPTLSGSKGAPFPALYLPGSSSVGQTSNGGFSQEGRVRILRQNTLYLVEAVNNGTKNPANAELSLLIAEIPMGA